VPHQRFRSGLLLLPIALHKPCCYLRRSSTARTRSPRHSILSAVCLNLTIPSRATARIKKITNLPCDASSSSRNRQPPNALIPAQPTKHHTTPAVFGQLSLFSPRLSAVFDFPFPPHTARRHPKRGWATARSPPPIPYLSCTLFHRDATAHWAIRTTLASRTDRRLQRYRDSIAAPILRTRRNPQHSPFRRRTAYNVPSQGSTAPRQSLSAPEYAQAVILVLSN
jgi:hypothetical protein